MNLFSKKFFSSRRGFTLIELLIVIAILGVLAAGILVAIDPIDKINQANDAKVQNDVSGIGRASEAYATTHNGFYPSILNDLFTAGELKRVPAPPTGYIPTSYGFLTTPSPCTAGTDCTRVIVGSQLKSKRFTATPYWNYDTSTGKSCAAAAVATGCP
ncbi:MAG: type II secretion system protein [Candidatus Levybacteria bacterium]|nr:type II secretion system protein [Candidatus Levybacteria bacterium]